MLFRVSFTFDVLASEPKLYVGVVEADGREAAVQAAFEQVEDEVGYDIHIFDHDVSAVRVVPGYTISDA